MSKSGEAEIVPSQELAAIPVVPDARQSDAAIREEFLDEAQAERRGRLVTGIGLGVAAVGATAGIFLGLHHDGKVAVQTPYSERAQHIVNAVDTGLEWVGIVGLPASLATLGTMNLAASRKKSTSASSISRLSATEQTSIKSDSSDGKRDGLIKKTVSGTSAITIAAVATAGLMTAIGIEISDGPDRPIDAMLGALPGDELAVPYKGVMPMVQATESNTLRHNIEATAANLGVTATSFQLNLGELTYKGQALSDLAIATEQEPSSPLFWQPEDGCTDIPVKIDKSAGIPGDARVYVNGVPARVVGQLEGTAAINRQGVAMSLEALDECIEHDPNAGVFGVALDADAATAKKIVTEAKQGLDEPATVITKEQFKHNSEEFWTANVKPITNVMSVLAGVLSFVAMGSIFGSRLLRNRREIATKLARGVSENHLRAVEITRGLKDGLVASVAGGAIATGGAPLINFLESGLRVGMDFKSAMVGAAVGLVGSAGGAAAKTRRLHKIADKAEQTRF